MTEKLRSDIPQVFTQFMVMRQESIAILIVENIFDRQISQPLELLLKSKFIKKEQEGTRRYWSIYKGITVTTFINRASMISKQVQDVNDLKIWKYLTFALNIDALQWPI